MIFLPSDISKKKRRSQHAKKQEGSELKVNQVPSTQEEDRTEVLQEEEEEAIIKPAAEGTGIPYKDQANLQSNHTTTTKTSPNHIHKNATNFHMGICDIYRQSSVKALYKLQVNYFSVIHFKGFFIVNPHIKTDI